MIETPHIKAKKEDIAKTVLMPGDPLRAKFIAETYLENYKLVNSVRGMLTYTGYYKDKKITIMGSGMGMPSMGIYCYELYKFFDVENIIRIGSAGTSNIKMNILDIVLVDNCYTEGNFANNYNNQKCYLSSSNSYINNVIENKARELKIEIKKGNTLCAECFDMYTVDNKIVDRVPVELDIIAAEMEAFALFYTANELNKKASCLLTIADSLVKKEQISSEDRQKSLTKMIELALESGIDL